MTLSYVCARARRAPALRPPTSNPSTHADVSITDIGEVGTAIETNSSVTLDSVTVAGLAPAAGRAIITILADSGFAMVAMTNWSAALPAGAGAPSTSASEFAVLHTDHGAFYSDTLVDSWNTSAGVVNLMDPEADAPLFPLVDTTLVASIKNLEVINGSASWLRSTRSVRSPRTACPAVQCLATAN